MALITEPQAAVGVDGAVDSPSAGVPFVTRVGPAASSR